MPTDTVPPKPVRDACKALPRPELIRRFEGGANILNPKVLELGEEALDTFFTPEAGVGLWSPRALVGHLADSELVLGHRMRRVVAEDRPIFALWDENAFVDRGLYAHPESPAKPGVAGHIAIIHTNRLWLAEWLRTVPEADWARQGMHPERGPMSLHDIVAIATWHVEYHGWFLDRKIERLASAH